MTVLFIIVIILTLFSITLLYGVVPLSTENVVYYHLYACQPFFDSISLCTSLSTATMKFMVVLVGAGSLAFLGAVICIIASVYPRKRAAPLSENGTLTPETLLQPLEPGSVAHAGPLGALHGSESYGGGNGLGGIGLEVPTLNELNLGEETGGGSTKQFSFSRLICTPVPVGECNTKDMRQRREQQQQQQQADEPLYEAGDEDWTHLRTTAEELRQMVLQQNDQILMDHRTIRELTGKLSECESGLEDERNVPERSVGVWSGNRRVMAGDDVSSSAAAQLQTARAVEELARAIMDLKDRIEKLEVTGKLLSTRSKACSIYLFYLSIYLTRFGSFLIAE